MIAFSRMSWFSNMRHWVISSFSSLTIWQCMMHRRFKMCIPVFSFLYNHHNRLCLTNVHGKIDPQVHILGPHVIGSLVVEHGEDAAEQMSLSGRLLVTGHSDDWGTRAVPGDQMSGPGQPDNSVWMKTFFWGVPAETFYSVKLLKDNMVKEIRIYLHHKPTHTNTNRSDPETKWNYWQNAKTKTLFHSFLLALSKHSLIDLTHSHSGKQESVKDYKLNYN